MFQFQRMKVTSLEEQGHQPAKEEEDMNLY